MLARRCLQRLASTKSAPSFRELLNSSPLLQEQSLRGKIVPAVVTKIEGKNVYVDFGLKFEGVIKTSQDLPRDAFTVGSTHQVQVVDIERTAHLLGDTRHTSALRALVSYHSPVPEAAGTAAAASAADPAVSASTPQAQSTQENSRKTA
eukprot:m.247545 g.247545  ORF g.247545 m.247545 type:complete len:149 (+) comp22600_c1_seq4:655-1101(+)